MKQLNTFLLLVFFSISLFACNSQIKEPSDVVQEYLQALVDKDVNSIAALVCSDWEEKALLEVDSLLSVDSRLDEVVCTVKESNNEQATVTCLGKILLTYKDEIQEIDLSRRIYFTQFVKNNWRVCGYQ